MSTEPERAEQLVEPVCVRVEEGVVDEILFDEHGEQAGEEPRVGAGSNLEVHVGELGGLGSARVDDDERPSGIVGDGLQDGASTREAV